MSSISFKATLSHFENSPLWGWHFLVSDEMARTFIEGNDRRVVCKINGATTIHCALMPNKGTWFVMLNQEIIKKLQLTLYGEIHVEMVKDDSKYGMPMPDEFQEVLYQEPDASKYFHELTAGKQRSLLYIVGKVKNTESRIKKSFAIADHLVANKGKLDFKMLNEAFKEYNKM